MPAELECIVRPPRHRAFRHLVLSSFFSLFGDGLFILASIVIVKEMSGGVAALSHMFILTMVPSVLLAPFAGALIDRFQRSQLAVGCQVLRALLHLATGGLLLGGTTSLPLLYAAVIINDTLYYFLVPTTDALTASSWRRRNTCAASRCCREAGRSGSCSPRSPRA